MSRELDVAALGAVSEGEVEDGVLTCEWHGARFDVCSGAARTLPATRGLRTYETRVRDGRILVVMDAP